MQGAKILHAASLRMQKLSRGDSDIELFEILLVCLYLHLFVPGTLGVLLIWAIRTKRPAVTVPLIESLLSPLCLMKTLLIAALIKIFCIKQCGIYKFTMPINKLIYETMRFSGV